MKGSFKILLLFYMLFLSVQTCSDLEMISCESGHEAEIHSEISSVNDHDHEDECSPICYCICCNSPITVEIKSIYISSITKSLVSLPCEINKVQNLNEPFWQPPEVV